MTTKIGPFLGINNRLPDFALAVRTRQVQGNYLRGALNVDIDNAGKLRLRKTATQLQALTAPHSLFMTDATNGFMVRDSVLYAVTLPSYTQVLLRVLASNAAMSYQQIGGDVYYSNGVDSGRITANTFYPFGLPTPNSPALTVIAGGLLAGWYQVGVSHLNSATGEEGGISASSNHELTVTGGLRVTLPPATTGATHVNIYLSHANGEVPYLLATVAAGTTTYDAVALPTGREGNGRFEEPLPAGRLFMADARLCSIKDNVIYVGLPYRYGYYLPAEGYLPFPTDISIAVNNQRGTFIAADKTYYIPGDLNDVKDKVVDVLPYGAVPGTEFKVPNKTQWGWFGEKGLVLVGTTPEVQAVMPDNIDLTPPASGISHVFEDDGYRRVVSCGWCVNLENLAATRYDNWTFSSLSGSYGTKSDGIYQTGIMGAVAWRVDFGKQDFGTEELKYLPNAYLGMACEEELLLTVTLPDGEEFTYPTRGFGPDLVIERVDVGKGLRASWFGLSLTNELGSYFTLASVSFKPANAERRI